MKKYAFTLLAFSLFLLCHQVLGQNIRFQVQEKQVECKDGKPVFVVVLVNSNDSMRSVLSPRFIIRMDDSSGFYKVAEDGFYTVEELKAVGIHLLAENPEENPQSPSQQQLEEIRKSSLSNSSEQELWNEAERVKAIITGMVDPSNKVLKKSDLMIIKQHTGDFLRKKDSMKGLLPVDFEVRNQNSYLLSTLGEKLQSYFAGGIHYYDKQGSMKRLLEKLTGFTGLSIKKSRNWSLSVFLLIAGIILFLMIGASLAESLGRDFVFPVVWLTGTIGVIVLIFLVL